LGTNTDCFRYGLDFLCPALDANEKSRPTLYQTVLSENQQSSPTSFLGYVFPPVKLPPKIAIPAFLSIRCFPKKNGFSIVEVVLALGVITFALVAILALLPLALQTSNDSVNDTRTSLIAQDALLRLKKISLSDPAGPWWYDETGQWISTPPFSKALYRVDISIGTLSTYPPHTDPAQQDPSNGYASHLMAGAAIVSWPVNPSTGAQVSNKGSKVRYSFYLRMVPDQ